VFSDQRYTTTASVATGSDPEISVRAGANSLNSVLDSGALDPPIGMDGIIGRYDSLLAS
jgi:hypothetical protein